jgi:hypothetical protein
MFFVILHLLGGLSAFILICRRHYLNLGMGRASVRNFLRVVRLRSIAELPLGG